MANTIKPINSTIIVITELEPNMNAKVNRYFLAIPVFDWQQAKLLGSETNWKVLQALRDVGMEGLSAEDISKKIRVPISSVYSILSKLEASVLVQSTMKRPRWGRPPKESKKRSKGKPTRIFVQTVEWAADSLDLDFVESLDPILKHMKKDIDELRAKWLPILENILLTCQTNNSKFFPKEQINEECGHSPEGLEFLDAINYELFQEITQGKDFDKLARKHKFLK